MKKAKKLYLFENELYSSLCNIEKIIEENIKAVKKEYTQLNIEDKNKLLMKIAEGENLDLKTLKKKYLKSKEIININKIISLNLIDESDILDKTEIDGIVYYYENKADGKVYNTKSEQVGIYKNNNIELHIVVI